MFGRLRSLFGNKRSHTKKSNDRNFEVVRQNGRYDAFGYNSATVATRDGRIGGAGSGDSHQRTDRERLILESRRLERDNPIYQGMIDKSTSYIVGNGFSLQAKTDDREWNMEAEATWKEFWKNPELTGLDSGAEIEQMVLREMLIAGDTGVMKTDTGKLQLVEAEQIKGRSGINDTGVIRDDNGTVTGYWVSPYGNFFVQTGSAVKVKKQDFLFLIRRRRPSAVRAVPPAQASFATLHRINDVCDSEAIARQLQARLAISINRPGGATIIDELADEDDKGAQVEGELTTKFVDFDYATVIAGEPGDDIRGIERTAPGRDFPQTIETFLRLLGLPLGLPLEIVLLNWTKSNFSQSRAVLEQAYQGFIAWQNVLKNGFHTPCYLFYINRAVKTGLLRDHPQKELHEWIAPTFPWIDQLAEAQAFGAKLDRSFCTHAEALKSQNKDREEVVSARQREILDAIQRSREIEDETGVVVPWQHFAGLEFSVNGATSSGSGHEDEEPEEPKKEEKEEEEEEEAKAQVIHQENHYHIQPTPITVEGTKVINKVEPAQIINKIETTPIVNKVEPAKVINKVEPTPVTVVNKVEPAQVINKVEPAKVILPARPTKKPKKMKITPAADGSMTAEEVE